MIDEREWKTWFEGKELTTDWLSKKISYWFPALLPFRSKKCSVLEIGSYEGRSAIAFLEYLPKSHLTAVDIFAQEGVEERFDNNLRPYGDRVTKIKGRGIAVMDEMLKKRSFDVIYLDTGKHRSRTFANSALAWPLLKVGGVLIWDDLTWGAKNTADARPHDGIWQFCLSFEECITYLHEGAQMIVRKEHEWPTMPQVEKISGKQKN